MQVKETVTYKFNELSEDGKEHAINSFRNNDDGFFWQDEASDTLKAFCDKFNITYYEIDYCESYRNKYRINFNEEIKDLKGIRLAKYLWNNYKNILYKGKYYSVNSNKIVKHNRVKSETLKNGNIFNAYYSAITLDNSCVLTGMCYDDDILKPIYEFMNNPREDVCFSELLDDCINSLCKSVRSDIEYQYSDKGIIETIEANDYDFTANGIIF